MSQFDGIDRRRFKRVEFPGARPIRLYAPESSQHSDLRGWVYADVINISLGGMCLALEANHVFEVNESVLLDFCDHQLDAASPLAEPVMARIRWVDQSPPLLAIGVQFDSCIKAIPDLMSERRHSRRRPPG